MKVQVSLFQKHVFWHQLTHIRWIIKLRVQYIKITSSQHVVYTNYLFFCFVFDSQNNSCTAATILFWSHKSLKISYSFRQSHYREVPRWEIFMEQELRFGLDLGQMANFPAFIASKSFDLWNHHMYTSNEMI